MTCEQGDRHRWDERRSRCLDCGRDAATIAVELEDWLIETEDSVDQLRDQIEDMRALLEEAANLLDGVSEKIRAKLAELDEQ